MKRSNRLAQLTQMARALDQVLQAELAQDWQRLQKAMAGVRQAVIEFGATLAPGNHETAEVVDRFVAEVFPKLEAAYRAAGSPCGPDEEGLWCWLRQQAAIAAEAERVARERAWQRGLAELQREVALRRGGPAGSERISDEAPGRDCQPSLVLATPAGETRCGTASVEGGDP